MLAMAAQPEELYQENMANEMVQSIERAIIGKCVRRIPRIGECVLINETCREFSRAHGGRYDMEYRRRYFGHIVGVYPHIVLLQMQNGSYISEKRSDFEVGLLRYVSLKNLPENENEITYDEKDVVSFAKTFARLLCE